MTISSLKHAIGFPDPMRWGPGEVTFGVPGKPIGINAAYLRAGFSLNRGKGGGKGLILSPAAKDFKFRVSAYALQAWGICGWSLPDVIARRSIELTVIAYNWRGDADASLKLTMDALEGIFYRKDSAVKRAIGDVEESVTGEPYIEITVRRL